MKLRNKFLVSIALTWLLFYGFIFIISFILLNENLINLKNSQNVIYLIIFFIIFSFIFATIILFLINYIILKRLESFKKEFIDSKQIPILAKINNQDELSLIILKYKELLHKINANNYAENQNIYTIPKLTLADSQLQKKIIQESLNQSDFVTEKNHLIRLSHYDSITLLPNRVFFNEILNKAISHARRHNKVLAVLFIDFDHFKKINDKYGNAIGDIFLKEMGHRFISILRAGDIIARLSGDEFIILLNDIVNPKFAGPVAEKLLQACRQPTNIEAYQISTTASIGVSVFPDDGHSLEELQKHADTAMYKAKQTGGGIYQYYQDKMDAVAHEHFKLESTLKNAIQNNEFILFFQPQLNLENGTIVSVEALMRWEHPELGLLNPERFIPLAEETGLITQIGDWALREACRINKSWQAAGYEPIVVAVNISPQQFRQENLVENIDSILKEFKLAPKYLELEITESAIVDDISIVKKKLNKISAMGVRIAIDDFGTGYTSINYLKQFPINVLKIDQAFIKGIPLNQNDLAITTAIIELGHSLGFEIVAEGVETTEQIQFLAENKCDLIQGYFLSRPLPAGKVILQFTKKKS